MIKLIRFNFVRKASSGPKFTLVPHSFNDSEEFVSANKQRNLLRVRVAVGRETETVYRELTDVSDAELDKEEENVRIRSFNFSSTSDAYLSAALLSYAQQKIHPRASTLLIFEIFLRSAYSFIHSANNQNAYYLFNETMGYPLLIDGETLEKVRYKLQLNKDLISTLNSPDYLYSENFYLQFYCTMLPFLSNNAKIEQKVVDSLEKTLVSVAESEVPFTDTGSVFNALACIFEHVYRYGGETFPLDDLRTVLERHLDYLISKIHLAPTHLAICFFCFIKELGLEKGNFNEILGKYFFEHKYEFLEGNVKAAMHALIYSYELYINHQNFPELPGIERISLIVGNLISEMVDKNELVQLTNQFVPLMKRVYLISWTVRSGNTISAHI